MGFLIDTNVVSEQRKGKKVDAKVRQWHQSFTRTGASP